MENNENQPVDTGSSMSYRCRCISYIFSPTTYSHQIKVGKIPTFGQFIPHICHLPPCFP